MARESLHLIVLMECEKNSTVGTTVADRRIQFSINESESMSVKLEKCRKGVELIPAVPQVSLLRKSRRMDRLGGRRSCIRWNARAD